MDRPVESRGFSLIELCVVIAIVAIGAAVATPGISAFVSSNRLSSTTNALLTDLQIARSEAATRGQPVTVCPRYASGTCAENWTRPRAVFTESSTASLGWDASDTMLRESPAPSGDNTITLNESLASLTYMPSGQIVYTGNADAIQFVICDGRMNAGDARVITVLRTGRAFVGRANVMNVTC